MEVEEQEQNEERKNCGNCGSYFKVHFNSVGTEDLAPHDEKQSMCIAGPQPILLNRFEGLMGLSKDQSPFIESCTHFKTRDDIALGRKVLDFFISREDHIKKQSYEPLLLELANFLIEDKEFESVDQVSNWILGKEEIPEPKETEEES